MQRNHLVSPCPRNFGLMDRGKKTVICDSPCQHKYFFFLLTRNREQGASVVRNGSWLVRFQKARLMNLLHSAVSLATRTFTVSCSCYCVTNVN